MSYRLRLWAMLDYIVSTHRVTWLELVEEMEEVALHAVREVVGADAVLEVAWDRGHELGMAISHVVGLVEQQQDPLNEVTVASVLPFDEGAQHGDVLVFDLTVDGTTNRQPGVWSLEPLQIVQPQAAAAVRAALQDALARYLPRPRWTEPSLGALVEAGGGWARGRVVVTEDGREVQFVGAHLHVHVVEVALWWVDFGIEIEVRDASGPHRLRLRKSQVGIPWWLDHATGRMAEPTLDDVMAGLTAKSQPHDALSRLLLALIAPPQGSFWAWVQREVPARFAALGPWRLRKLRFATANGPAGYGHVVAQAAKHETEVTVALGKLSHAAFGKEAPGDVPAERAVERVLADFQAWLEVEVDADQPYAYGIDYALIPWLEFASEGTDCRQRITLVDRKWSIRVRGGPEAGSDPRLADLVNRSAARDGGFRTPSAVIAAIEVGPWSWICCDNVEHMPFGGTHALWLLGPDGTRGQVMQAGLGIGYTIDDDLARFLSLCAWLSDLVVRHAPDLVLSFPDDTIPLGEWLQFGMPRQWPFHPWWQTTQPSDQEALAGSRQLYRGFLADLAVGPPWAADAAW